jgi:transcriptional regulator with XRE-family HTH domain
MADPLPRPRPKRGRHRAQDADRHVGARVRARRIALGLTQQRLAALVGIRFQQVAKYETGALRIGVGLLYALARALGVEPGHFYEGLGAAEPPGRALRRRRLLELARDFAALPRPQQEALVALARALAATDEGAAEPASPGARRAATRGPS